MSIQDAWSGVAVLLVATAATLAGYAALGEFRRWRYRRQQAKRLHWIVGHRPWWGRR